jgi:hypothetical protein
MTKKYGNPPKPKKPDERQPHIHVVKTRIETIPERRRREDSESEASTSHHTSRDHSRESSRHESSPDRSRHSSAGKSRTPSPAREGPSSSRRSRSKQRSGPKQRRPRSLSQSSRSPSRQLEVELTTAPKKKTDTEKMATTRKPGKKIRKNKFKIVPNNNVSK